MASPKTVALNAELAASAAKSRAETQARLEAEGRAGPSPRKSFRWIGTRTKGLPYSRMMLKDTVPAMPGQPARFLLVHPTRGTTHLKTATPELVALFFPSLPPELAVGMLGRF